MRRFSVLATRAGRGLRPSRARAGSSTGTGRSATSSPPLSDDGVPFVERRRTPRRRALIGAQTIFRNGYCSMRCHIEAVSEGGALLRPADITLCTDKFILKPRFDPPRDCEVVWWKGETLGVHYV
jgi:hypothetical protein